MAEADIDDTSILLAVPFRADSNNPLMSPVI